MLDKDQAQSLLEDAAPDFPVKAWAKYNDLYLFRVQFNMPGEENFDPFFSVDANTGEVKEFSVLQNIDEISKLDWHEV